MVIQEPGQLDETWVEDETKVEDHGGSQEVAAEDEGEVDVEELILDLMKTGEDLLQAGFKVF